MPGPASAHQEPLSPSVHVPSNKNTPPPPPPRLDLCHQAACDTAPALLGHQKCSSREHGVDGKQCPRRGCRFACCCMTSTAGVQLVSAE